VRQHLTKLYHPDGVTTYPYCHIAYRTAGSINASPKDLANYVRFYLQRGSFDGAQLLQPAFIERMETPETLPSAKLGRMAGYGLCNYETCEGAFVFHGHQGAMPGALTEMAYLPYQGRGYVVMINSGSWRAQTRISELVRHYLIRDLTPPRLPPVASVPAEVRQHYEGYYQDISPSAQLLYGVERLLATGRVDFTTDGASLIGLRPAQLVPVTDKLFRKKDQSIATLALLPDSDGKTLIQYNWITYKKIPGWRVWGEILGIFVVSISMLSSPIFVLVWLARKRLGKLDNAGPLSLRLMPLLSAFFWRILGSDSFQLVVGKSLDTGHLLRGFSCHHAFEYCFCPDRSREPLFSCVSLAYPHESLGLLAFGSGSHWRLDCCGLYGLLGLDWTASLGLLEL
jgi:hypothetical protein